jgi:serine/threonine-protein kinase
MNPTTGLRAGTAIGSYELLRPIGRGATGVVYEAVHRSLGRRAALKVLSVPPADAAHAERMAVRFLREGRIAAQVRHPHIVDVFDFGMHGEVPYLVMELVEGETLARLLQRETKLALARAIEILLPILSAVAELHAAGIVHRDIKPGNILLAGRRERWPKLSDFGVSRLDDGSPSITRSGVTLGTPEYMAPERMRAAGAATERSDQYALGATLYEVTSGIKPFGAETAHDLLQAIARGDLVPPSAREPSLPKAFDEVLLRAMNREPGGRFSSVDELAVALLPFASATVVEKWRWEAGAASVGTRLGRSLPVVPAFGPTATELPRHLAEPTGLRLEREQQATDAARMRSMLGVGALVWCAFFVVDYFVATRLGVATVRFFATVRLVVLAEILVQISLFRKGISLRARAAVSFVGHCVASGAIALMCVPFLGIASPYAPGICLVLVHRTLSSSERWKQGLLGYGIPAALYPLVMLGSALFDPSIARQLHDTRALMLFAINLAFVFGTAGLATAGGHLVWTLRRAVFEARLVGGYKLKRRIGHGATGEVWLAHHAALKRDVAVKILRPEASSDVGISRFEREAHATAELAHPNTVRIFDFGTTEDGLWYYAMELLEGETLADLVRREGPLLPARTIQLALQAARALAEAHARNIVHRDVKPSNLFVTTMGGERDFVKVLDFGIARFFRAPGRGEATLTKDGGIVGTPAYISPEAVLGAEVDARADVYALGAVVYFMLTAHPPFEAANEGVIGLMLAQVSRPPQPPSLRLGAPLPADLEAFVMRCLQKAPAARYADATELVAALRACHGAREGVARTEHGRVSESAPQFHG